LKPEAAVVGAGPAGILAATVISEEGYAARVYEEHPVIGEPNHCAGLLSVEGLDVLGVDPSDEFIQNKVYGGRVYAPDGGFIEIRDRRPRAYVVDRSRFDRYLAAAATDAGVEFMLSSRVEGLRFMEGTCMGVKAGGDAHESWIVVDAEGAGGRLLSRSGIETGQSGILTGYNAEIRGVEVDPDIVEVWFGDTLAEGFYAWVIPIDEATVRCGLGTVGVDGYDRLKGFVRKRFDAEPRRVTSGQICTGPPVDKTAYSGLLLAGDVAGQVKATTGGGVVVGGLCARLAGETAAEALGCGDACWGRLSEYERRWRGLYEGELKTMYKARRLLNRMPDERLNRLLANLKEAGLEEVLGDLVSRGDMDMQAGVIREAARNPRLMYMLLRGVGVAALRDLVSLLW
jgi:digeranylgeranylglycerophospholipid reductase